MMNNTRIGLLILSIFAFEHVDAKQTDNQKSVTRKVTRPTVKKQMAQKTNGNNHDVIVEERPLHRHEKVTPSVDKKVQEEPDGTVIETVTTTQAQDNKVVTTTETWSWSKIAAIAAGVGLTALAGAAAYNSYYNPTPNNQQPPVQSSEIISNQTEPIIQPSTVPNTANQQPKKYFLEKGFERYLDTVAANPDLDNQMAGDNYIAPDEFDAMMAHPVTEAMMLPFDAKDRIAIAAQNIQDPHFKLGTSVDASLEKIHQLNSQEDDAYVKNDEGDMSLAHTVSNLGMARMYGPAYRGMREINGVMLQGPGMSNTINYAQQAKQAFLTRNNPQLLLPAPANTAKTVTTVTPAQQQAMTNLMKTNPNQFTTAIRTQAGSPITINQQAQASTLSHTAMLPEQSPQTASTIRPQTVSNVKPKTDTAIIKTTEIAGHTALESPKFNPNLDPKLAGQSWTPGGNYFPAQS
jgi:hypothetical protein